MIQIHIYKPAIMCYNTEVNKICRYCFRGLFLYEIAQAVAFAPGAGDIPLAHSGMVFNLYDLAREHEIQRGRIVGDAPELYCCTLYR